MEGNFEMSKKCKKKCKRYPKKCDGSCEKPKKITLKRYQKFVISLASPDSMKTVERKLGTSGLGLAGEAGEFADVIKKVLFHGMDLDEEVHDRLVKELGDIMWYVAFAAETLQVDLQTIIDANVEKLSARYASGKFTKKEFMNKEKGKPPKKKAKMKSSKKR
jgi:NTP pyrophosphatase (non-canonical NTP hydrolase)